MEHSELSRESSADEREDSGSMPNVLDMKQISHFSWTRTGVLTVQGFGRFVRLPDSTADHFIQKWLIVSGDTRQTTHVRVKLHCAQKKRLKCVESDGGRGVDSGIEKQRMTFWPHVLAHFQHEMPALIPLPLHRQCRPDVLPRVSATHETF